MKAALKQQPANESINEEIRKLDEESREELFPPAGIYAFGRGAVVRRDHRFVGRSQVGRDLAAEASATAARRGPARLGGELDSGRAVDRRRAVRRACRDGGRLEPALARHSGRETGRSGGCGGQRGNDTWNESGREDRTGRCPHQTGGQRAGPGRRHLGRRNGPRLALLPRPWRLRNLAATATCPTTGTARPARTSSGSRLCRWPATARRWSWPAVSSSRAQMRISGKSFATMRRAGKLLWQRDVPSTPDSRKADGRSTTTSSPAMRHAPWPATAAMWPRSSPTATWRPTILTASSPGRRASASRRIPTATPPRCAIYKNLLLVPFDQATRQGRPLEAAGIGHRHRPRRLGAGPRGAKFLDHADRDPRGRPRPGGDGRQPLDHRLRSGRRQGIVAGQGFSGRRGAVAGVGGQLRDRGGQRFAPRSLPSAPTAAAT